MDFVILDETTSASAGQQYGGPFDGTTLQRIASALEVYLDRDVASEHGGSYRVRVGSSSTDIMPGEIACAIVDALPDAPGAVAYHDVSGAAVPVVFCAKTACNSLTSGPDSVSNALAHELAEVVGDPACNLWADGNDGQEHCRELCDPVQEWGYLIGDVTVSDFVLPNYFAPGSLGPWNFGAKEFGGPALSGPLTTAPGGYQLVRSSGTGETQVTGEIAPRRLAKKQHPTSRTYRRGWRGARAS